MREILFRAKTVCDGDWIYGGITWNPSKKKVFIYTEWDEGEVIPETVGQYTGMTDKNGKKIFESDIVKMSYRGDVLTAVVRFGNYNQPDKILKTHLGFYFDFDTVNFEDFRKDVGYWTGRTFGEIEVIGNIYDDLDLIKA